MRVNLPQLCESYMKWWDNQQYPPYLDSYDKVFNGI